MKLRIKLSLINFRQVDVTVADGITPGRLVEVARTIAQRMHGPHDSVTIQSVEELPEVDQGKDEG